MAGDSYARSELEQEGWDERLRRVCKDTRELVAATRAVIARSHASLAQADASLKERP